MRALTVAVKRQLVAFDKSSSISSVSVAAMGDGPPPQSSGGDDEDGRGSAPRRGRKDDEDENAEEDEENEEGKLRFKGAVLSLHTLCSLSLGNVHASFFSFPLCTGPDKEGCAHWAEVIKARFSSECLTCRRLLSNAHQILKSLSAVKVESLNQFTWRGRAA